MYLKTFEEWEYINEATKAFNPPNSRLYPLVQLTENGMLFHIDIVLPDLDSDRTFNERIIISNIVELFKFIKQAPSLNFLISLQSRKEDNENEEYDISTINKIISAKDSNGQLSYIYECANGKNYIDNSITKTENEISYPKTTV